MRRAARVDDNQKDIVRALEGAGCGVVSLAAIGKGCPDLLVHAPFYPHKLFLMEIKNPRQLPCKQRLRNSQKEFAIRWKAPIYVIKTIDEALDAVGITRKP